MKKAPRNFLFALVLLAFATVAPVLVLYALGYRYDNNSHALRKTATIGIEPEGQSVKVYFDDRFVAEKKDNIIIPGITSAAHHVALTKNDAFTWEQDVETSPGMITWLTNIILYRANLGRTAVTASTDNVVYGVPSSTENSFALVVTRGTDTSATIQIRDRKTQGTAISVTEAAIKAAIGNIKEFAYPQAFFTQNDSWLIVPFSTTSGEKSSIALSTKDGSFYNLAAFIPANTSVFADSKDQFVFFYVDGGKRKTFDLSKKSLSEASETLYAFHRAITTYTIREKDGVCTMHETLDVIGTTREIGKLTCGKFDVRITPNNNLFIINTTTHEANFLDTRAKRLEKLSENTTRVSFAAQPASGDVAVYTKGSELWAFVSATDKNILLTRTADSIQSFLVNTLGTHVVYLSNKTLAAQEITDSRLPVSVSWSLTSPRAFLLPGSTEETIFASEETQTEKKKMQVLSEVTMYDL